MTTRGLWDLRGACLLQLMAMGLFNIFEAFHMAEAGLRPSTIGQLLALENLLFIVVSPLWGMLADRTGRFRKLIMVGTVACSLNLIVFAFADSGPEFLVYAVIRGLFAPGIQSLMPTLAVAVVGPKKPGSGFGRYRAFGSIGFILGTAVLPLIFGDIATTSLVASVFLFGSVGMIQRLPRVTMPATSISGGPDSVPVKSLILFFLAYFLLQLTDPAVHGFLGAYARSLGADVATVGLIASTTGFMALVGLPVVGAWVDRVGAHRIFLIACGCQVVRMYFPAHITDPSWLWTTHVLHFVAWPGREIGAMVLLSQLVPPVARGRVFALLSSVRMAGMMVGAFLMGELVEVYGYQKMYVIMGAVAAPGILVFWLFWHRMTKVERAGSGPAG